MVTFKNRFIWRGPARKDGRISTTESIENTFDQEFVHAVLDNESSETSAILIGIFITHKKTIFSVVNI